MPCADCTGIETEVTLYSESGRSEGTFNLKETYLGARDGDRVETTTGRWAAERGTSHDPDVLVYRLRPSGSGSARAFRLTEEREIRLLDPEDREFAPELPYSLALIEDTSPADPAH